MRVLVLIDAYPPDFVGGHEVRCKRTVEGLRSRGHGVQVLTTYRRENGPQAGDSVLRMLRSKWSEDPRAGALKWARVYRHNRRVFDKTMTAYRPDVIMQWNLMACTAAFVHYVHSAADVPRVTVVGGLVPSVPDDLWLHFCTTAAHGSARRALKRVAVSAASLLIPTQRRPLQYDAVAFLSKFLEDVWLNREGAVVRRSAVTYLGVDTDKFGLRVTSGYCNPPRFLYAGRLDPEKDPLTCLDAAEIAALRRLPVKLTIAAADSLDTGYAQHVARRAQEVVSSVRLVRGTPPDRMPALLHDNDVLILPSRSEGLSNLLLEAMACGLAVLATRCGGPDEILVDGENCLIFPFGHAEALAERMARLTREPDVVARLGQNAQRLVRQRFTMSDYLDKVEALLQQTIADYPQLRSAPKGVREG